MASPWPRPRAGLWNAASPARSANACGHEKMRVGGHYAFCETLGEFDAAEYEASLLDGHVWTFWWD